MATNGTHIAAEPRLEEEKFSIQKIEYGQSGGKRAPERTEPAETTENFALAPLVDKIAFGIAKGLVVAMKELEHHIASETRKVGDTVERRLDTLHQELTRFVGEQRTTNAAVQDQLQQLTTAGTGLRETDARQAAELEALRAEAREFSVSVLQRIDTSTASLKESDAKQAAGLEALQAETKAFSSTVSERISTSVTALQEADARQAADLAALQSETRAATKSVSQQIDSLCRDLGVQQEDIGAVKSTLTTHCARVDALVERLDRQADAVRLMHTAYSQRETELEQLVDGLARLRAYPTPLPATGL